jgi:hypothetical protein
MFVKEMSDKFKKLSIGLQFYNNFPFVSIKGYQNAKKRSGKVKDRYKLHRCDFNCLFKTEYDKADLPKRAMHRTKGEFHSIK